MPLGSILGGIIGSNGAYAAGNDALGAGNLAFQNAQQEESRNRASVSPWTNVGGAAASELSSLYGLGSLGAPDANGVRSVDTAGASADQAAARGRFTASPGYQFRTQQGINALDRSAASRGMTLSGAQTKALNDYGQGQASSEYGNYVSGLNALSTGGLGATTTTNNTDAGIFNGGNQDQFQGGMSRAASISNGANALASGISGGINSLVSGAAYAAGGGFGGMGGGQGDGYTVAGAPAGGYGGYAGYANTLPGFASV